MAWRLEICFPRRLRLRTPARPSEKEAEPQLQLDVAAAEMVWSWRRRALRAVLWDAGHRGEGKARAFEPRSAILHRSRGRGPPRRCRRRRTLEVQFFSDTATTRPWPAPRYAGRAGGLAHAVARDRYERATGASPTRSRTLARATWPARRGWTRQTRTEIGGAAQCATENGKDVRLVSAPPWPDRPYARPPAPLRGTGGRRASGTLAAGRHAAPLSDVATVPRTNAATGLGAWPRSRRPARAHKLPGADPPPPKRVLLLVLQTPRRRPRRHRRRLARNHNIAAGRPRSQRKASSTSAGSCPRPTSSSSSSSPRQVTDSQIERTTLTGP